MYLSKILKETKYRRDVVITDECIDVSQLLGTRARALTLTLTPIVYAYGDRDFPFSSGVSVTYPEPFLPQIGTPTLLLSITRSIINIYGATKRVSLEGRYRSQRLDKI